MILTGCQKEPSACLNVSTTTVSVGQYVSFSDCSIDAHSYLWEFGDGSTSTDQNPIHKYSSKGTYVAKLTASSKNGNKSDEISTAITVTNEISTNELVDLWNYDKVIYSSYKDNNLIDQQTTVPTSATLQFATGGGYVLSESGITSAGTWEFTNSNSALLLDKSTTKEATGVIDLLTSSDFQMTITEVDNSGGYEYKEVYQKYFSK